jgi:uncharacterized protein (DUF488 family)
MTSARERGSRRGVDGVGYQGRDVEAVVGELVAGGVAVVADVRLAPVSRKRGFAKRAFAAALADAGIGYRHLPALGNPRPNRAGFAATGTDLNRARMRYAALLERPEAQAALAEIAELARTGTVALLCFEADERHCHRHVLLERLTQAPA